MSNSRRIPLEDLEGRYTRRFGAGYSKTKRMLQDAAKRVDLGHFPEADALVRFSGASAVDLSNILGRERMAAMAAWSRAEGGAA